MLVRIKYLGLCLKEITSITKIGLSGNLKIFRGMDFETIVVSIKVRDLF
jgi:hypothetical protein